LTKQEAEQITNIFVILRQQQAVPIQLPEKQVREAPTELNSFKEGLEKYRDEYFVAVARTAGEKTVGIVSKTIGIGGAILAGYFALGSLCQLLIDQLTQLADQISNWLAAIGFLGLGG